MPPAITWDFPAAGRVTNMNCIIQIERFDELGKIVGVSVEIVSSRRLTRPSVTAAIVCDAAITSGREKVHLVIKRVGRQRPTMTEDHWLAAAPVVVIDLRPIFCRNRAHSASSNRCMRYCL